MVFLDGLRSAFGAQWYIQAQTLFFYHDSEFKRETYFPTSLEPARLVDLARSSPLWSSQLPLRVGGGGVILEGPSGYRDTWKTTLSAMDQRTSHLRLVTKVIKLNYAQADDQTIQSSDRSINIPGVATILRNLIEGGGSIGSIVQSNRASVGGLLGQGLSSQGQAVPSQTNQGRPNRPSKGETSNPSGELEGGRVMADPRRNAVIIYDLEERIPQYEAIIRELDRETHLVEIHAAIVDVSDNYRRDLGVNFQSVSGSGDVQVGAEVSTSSGQFSPLPQAGSPAGQGAVISTVYTQGSNYFIARVQALEREGGARLLGRPTVLTLDNQEATLENTTTYYIEVAGNEAVDLFKVDAGTILRVTPHIIEGKNGQPASIRLTVTVQDNQGSGESASTAGTNLAIPPLKQTKINTQAVVQAGQSLLIGGYYFESRQAETSGPPILKDIPILGHLFKTSSQSTNRMERMALITPRIIRLGEIQSMPSHLDDAAMSRSPTQTSYEPRIVQARGGCAGR
jgi:type III secretion protein C